MARIAYVNGRYRPLAGAAIALEDRGYQFADGVYEVIKVLGGRARDLERHLDRLQRSLAALAIMTAVTERARSRSRGSAWKELVADGGLSPGRRTRATAGSTTCPPP